MTLNSISLPVVIFLRILEPLTNQKRGIWSLDIIRRNVYCRREVQLERFRGERL